MPVRFKDTAEYHHRFSPQETTQKLQMNSSKEPTDRRGRYSNDDYVLLGNQSKFAPNIRYRLRPTPSGHQIITPPPPPPPPPPPHQGHTDASLHKRETNRVRGQSSSQGYSDVEGSVLIGQGVNSRRSQGCQSNADDLGGDRKTKRRLIPGREEMVEEAGLLLRGIAMGDEEKVKGHRLGQTYKVIQGSHLLQKDSPPSSKEKQKQQQPHHHHHQHGDDDVRWISSKEDHLRFDQATQTKNTAHHHHHELGLEEESNEERQRRRTMGRNRTKGDERQENKENRHSHSPDYQPISTQDNSYHRNRNNNSSLAGNQKIVFSYDDKRRKEKSGGERDPDLERLRGREVDAIGHRGRETEPQSLGLRAINLHHDKNRSNHNTEEMKAKKSGGGIHRTSSSSSAHPPPPSLRHHPQQQHLEPKRLRSSSRDTKLKSVDGSSRHESMLRSSRDGVTVGGWRTGHGKTSVEQMKLLREKRSGKEEKVTSGDRRSSSVHGSIAQDKRSSGVEEDKGGGSRTQGSQMHEPSNVITSQHSHPQFSSKVHPSNRSSKAEQGLRTEDESHHHLLQQPLSVGYLKEDHPSEYQTQFQWRQTPTSELIVDQQQQQRSASVALHHPHRSASVISLSHPDFRTLFPSTNDGEDTEYRFQFRPISARNHQSSDRENFAAQTNQMRRGQSLRDLSTGERNEETMERTSSVGVMMKNKDQPRNYRSEYTRNFQPPWNYQYEDGAWKEMEKGRRKKETSQIGASVDVDSSSRSLLLQSSSSDVSSWFEEVLELRRHADEYRRRANGTHFSREQLQQLYARNVDSMRRTDGGERRTDEGERKRTDGGERRTDGGERKRTDGGERRTDGGERKRTDGGERRTDGGERKRTDGGERRTDGGERKRTDGGGSGGRLLRHHFDRTSHKHSNDGRREGRPVSSTSSCGDESYDDDEMTNTRLRFQDNGGGRGRGGSESDEEQQRPLEVGVINQTKEEERRYDDDRPSSVLSNLHAYHPGFSLSTEKRHQGGRRSSEVISRRDIGRTKRTPAQTYTVSKEDKGVQIDLEGGTAFPSNRRKILSSSSLASQVLQRARNRNNEFWSK